LRFVHWTTPPDMSPHELTVSVTHKLFGKILGRPARQVNIDVWLVEADRQCFRLPRPRRMRDDDRHVGKIDCHIIDIAAVGVFEAQCAARRSGFTVDSESRGRFCARDNRRSSPDRRPLAHPEIFSRSFLVGLPGFIVGLTTGNFRVRVNVDGDEILGLHSYSSASAHDWGTGIVISSAIWP